MIVLSFALARAMAHKYADSFGEPFEAEISHEAEDPWNLTQVMLA